MGRTLVLTVVRAVAVVAAVLTLTFLLLHLAPGDPVVRLLGPLATPSQIAAARHALALDRPWFAQYLVWIGHAARGDFGTSIATGEPVGAMIARSWPATALLVLLSLTLTWVGAIVIGTLQAGARRTGTDSAITVVTTTMASVPSYWLGLVLVLLFTYEWRLLPAFGASGVDAEYLDPFARVVDLVRHIALPLLTLTIIGAGGMARFVRTGMRRLRDAPFIATSRAKGVRRWRTTVRHQLRNALIPLIALVGLSLPAFFSGTVFVESIFAWPGVGRLLVQGVEARDYPVVMAATTISAVLVVVGNLLAEGLLRWADPRTRAGI